MHGIFDWGGDAFGNIMPHLSLPHVKMQSLYLGPIPSISSCCLHLFSSCVASRLRLSPYILSTFARESGRDRRQVAEQV